MEHYGTLWNITNWGKFTPLTCLWRSTDRELVLTCCSTLDSMRRYAERELVSIETGIKFWAKKKPDHRSSRAF